MPSQQSLSPKSVASVRPKDTITHRADALERLRKVPTNQFRHDEHLDPLLVHPLLEREEVEHLVLLLLRADRAVHFPLLAEEGERGVHSSETAQPGDQDGLHGGDEGVIVIVTKFDVTESVGR
jgi:hypothetical protein